MSDAPVTIEQSALTSERIEEVSEVLKVMIEFAYENGFHEIGWDPVAEVSAALRELLEARRRLQYLEATKDEGPTGDYRDRLYASLVRRGYAQHHAYEIAYGEKLVQLPSA